MDTSLASVRQKKITCCSLLEVKALNHFLGRLKPLYERVHSSTTNADSRLVQLPSKIMNITFDLDLVEPLNDFETDDSELFLNETLNQVNIKIAYQSII